MDFDVEIIRKIARSGGAAELYSIMLGISKHCTKKLDERESLTIDQRVLFTHAVSYLEELALREMKRDTALTAERREDLRLDFERWLEVRAPGLVWEDVVQYLRSGSTRL